MKTPIAIAALVVATISFGAALPALADDAAPPPPAPTDTAQHNGPGHRMGPMSGPSVKAGSAVPMT